MKVSHWLRRALAECRARAGFDAGLVVQQPALELAHTLSR